MVTEKKDERVPTVSDEMIRKDLRPEVKAAVDIGPKDIINSMRHIHTNSSENNLAFTPTR